MKTWGVILAVSLVVGIGGSVILLGAALPYALGLLLKAFGL